MQLDGALLAAADGQVTFATADTPRELFRVQPPASHDDWVALGARLATDRRDLAGGDFGAMVDHFGGNRRVLTGGSISDVHFARGAYRFTLDLRPGYDLGNWPISGIAGPGRYVVTYAPGGRAFTAQPASPASPRLDLRGPARPVDALRPVALDLTVANDGLEDTGELPLVVLAQRPGEKPEAISEQAVEVGGAGQRHLVIAWTPAAPGDWTITARLGTQGGVADANPGGGRRSPRWSPPGARRSSVAGRRHGRSPTSARY